MKIFALGGVPCSGKTTFMKRFIMRNMKDSAEFKFKTVRGTVKGNLAIVGVYDDSVFSGTDRLSMAVQPDFENWIRILKKQGKDLNVVFEGDRLFTASVIKFLLELKINVKALVLEVNKKERDRRQAVRKDSQTEKFISSRRTKYDNILNQNLAEKFFHETPEDTDFLIKELEKFLEIQNR